MAGKGFILLHRQITDNWLWNNKPFADGQAWIDLLLLANHVEREKPYKGQMKKYMPGTVNYSLTFLADRWGWSWKRVKRFVKLLEKAKMVTTDVTKNDTTISIVNWDLYQHIGRTNVTTIRPNEGTNEGTNEGHINNNVNNDKEWGRSARTRATPTFDVTSPEFVKRMCELVGEEYIEP